MNPSTVQRQAAGLGYAVSWYGRETTPFTNLIRFEQEIHKEASAISSKTFKEAVRGDDPKLRKFATGKIIRCQHTSGGTNTCMHGNRQEHCGYAHDQEELWRDISQIMMTEVCLGLNLTHAEKYIREEISNRQLPSNWERISLEDCGTGLLSKASIGRLSTTTPN